MLNPLDKLSKCPCKNKDRASTMKYTHCPLLQWESESLYIYIYIATLLNECHNIVDPVFLSLCGMMCIPRKQFRELQIFCQVLHHISVASACLCPNHPLKQIEKKHGSPAKHETGLCHCLGCFCCGLCTLSCQGFCCILRGLARSKW